MKHNPTKCPGCKKGHVVMIDSSGGAVDYDYICSRVQCDWQSVDFARTAAYRADLARERRRPMKKVHAPEFQPDSPEFQARLRAEVDRRMARLEKERAKFPPTFIKKGKKAVLNPKFTDEMREHMHKFYVDVAEIREELLNA